MKGPNSVRGAEAFRVTSTATVASSSDATREPVNASKSGSRFYWDWRSNSVETLTLHQEGKCHE